MLCWMSEHTRQDEIRNEYMRKKNWSFSHCRKMWFGYVWKRTIEALIRRVNQMKASPIHRGRGRQRKTIVRMIKKDLELNDLL
ncbi:hypothetical protein Lal_00039133 [Lupinus albus]|nr:hypothetical protein Lal_00039133 [Lupinus albus]